MTKWSQRHQSGITEASRPGFCARPNAGPQGLTCRPFIYMHLLSHLHAGPEGLTCRPFIQSTAGPKCTRFEKLMIHQVTVRCDRPRRVNRWTTLSKRLRTWELRYKTGDRWSEAKYETRAWPFSQMLCVKDSIATTKNLRTRPNPRKKRFR